MLPFASSFVPFLLEPKRKILHSACSPQQSSCWSGSVLSIAYPGRNGFDPSGLHVLQVNQPSASFGFFVSLSVL